MNTNKYFEISDIILSEIKAGMKGDNIVGDLIYKGYSYRDIEYVLNALINEGKIDVNFWRYGSKTNLLKNKKNGIKLLSNLFSNDSDKPKQYSRFQLWIAVNKRSIIGASVGLVIIVLIFIIISILYWNSSGQVLSRAFNNSFGAKTFKYEVNIGGSKYDVGKAPDESYTYTIDIIGSFISNNFSGGLKVSEINSKNGENIKKEEFQSIILGAGHNNRYLRIDNYVKNGTTSESIKEYVLGKWIEGDNFLKLRKKVNIGFDELFTIQNNVWGFSSDDMNYIKKVLISGKFLGSSQRIKSDINGLKKIMFSLNRVNIKDLSSVINKFIGIGVINKQWLIDASWVAYINKNGTINTLIIKPEAYKNLGRIKINEIIIKFSSYNSNFNILKPLSVISEGSIIKKLSE